MFGKIHLKKENFATVHFLVYIQISATKIEDATGSVLQGLLSVAFVTKYSKAPKEK